MCTAVAYRDEGLYFGRTLDWDFPYDSRVVITPRHFVSGRGRAFEDAHRAVIGMAYVVQGYPLYFDGANECGLCMAGLNFTGNGKYEKSQGKDGEVPQFDLIAFVLSRCGSAFCAKELLKTVVVTDEPFNSELKAAALHWLVADAKESFVLEITKDGTRFFDNPYGILTNNPPFEKQVRSLEKYSCLFADEEESSKPDEHFTRGSGAKGLPGDWTSSSRFVRGNFVLSNSKGCKTVAPVAQCFHIMDSVSVPVGSMRINGSCEYTQYTCCIDAARGVYYYTTYENHRICAVDIKAFDLEGTELLPCELVKEQDVYFHK